MQVRVEAVAKITVNNSLSVGDKIWFSATVRLNEDQIYVSQMVLTVTDNFENTKDDLVSEYKLEPIYCQNFCYPNIDFNFVSSIQLIYTLLVLKLNLIFSFYCHGE